MWKHRWSLPAVVLCLQCGGSTTPAEEPPGEPEATEETQAPSSGAESPGAGEESTPGESAGDEPEAKETPAKKACADLKKSDCEVTVGCAWSTLKKCVDEGPAE